MTLTDEFLTAARAAVPAVRIYDADRPNNDGSAQTPKRYAVLSADPGSVDALALCGTSDSAVIEFGVLTVALVRSEVEAIQVAIRGALVDRVFAAPPWSAEIVEHHSQEVRVDPDIPGRTVLFGTDQYTAHATRT